ncbi:hypothetical protein KRP22_005282 [Phytophthora ramorum]|nr:hypothetical protein KRP22_12867 [Phytophthora ramorum]
MKVFLACMRKYGNSYSDCKKLSVVAHGQGSGTTWEAGEVGDSQGRHEEDVNGGGQRGLEGNRGLRGRSRHQEDTLQHEVASLHRCKAPRYPSSSPAGRCLGVNILVRVSK